LQPGARAVDTFMEAMSQRSIEQQATEVAVTHRVRRDLASLEAPPHFSAFLDALLDIEPRRTEPLFEELVSQDDLVFARAPERCDFEYYVGHRTVLSRRLRDVAEFLEFGPDERNLLLSRLHSIPAA
jgi:hypothetical protein